MIYYLLALIFYLGVVYLPCNTDCCKYDNTWTYHPIMNEMGMSQDQFEFLWRKFHISSVDLSHKEKEQEYFYVRGNEDLEDNALTGDPIDRHQHQS